jgi:hypothetical protein
MAPVGPGASWPGPDLCSALGGLAVLAQDPATLTLCEPTPDPFALAGSKGVLET